MESHILGKVSVIRIKEMIVGLRNKVDKEMRKEGNAAHDRRFEWSGDCFGISRQQSQQGFVLQIQL